MYHWCSTILKEGSIIQPGNWGRMINIDGPNHGGYKIETIFENIRRVQYPYRPSRLNCVFLCPNLESALHFKFTNNRKYEILYEVEILDKGKNMFLTDWNLIDRSLSYEQMLERAQAYWAETEVIEGHQEILINGEIRIIKKIDLENAFDITYSV